MEATLTGLPLPAPFLEGLRDAMERLSDGPLAPALDLYATRGTIVVKVALPGPKPADVDISIDDRLVTISGSVRQEMDAAGATYVHRELSCGAFSRSFWLPTAVNTEAATASLEEGLLTLTLPKTDEVAPKRVKVEVV
jgi:HSP20 family protein